MKKSISFRAFIDLSNIDGGRVIREQVNLLESEIKLPPGNNAIMAPGRYNPPTIGHQAMVKLLIKKAKELSTPESKVIPVVVIVAGAKSSLDKQKNPLSADDRVKIFEKRWGNKIKVLVAADPITAAKELQDQNINATFVVSGSDRSYKDVLDKYAPIEGYEHHAVPMPSERQKPADQEAFLADLEKTGKTPNIASVSGSLAKKAAQLGYRKAFRALVQDGGAPSDADVDNIFDKVQAALNEPVPTKKKAK